MNRLTVALATALAASAARAQTVNIQAGPMGMDVRVETDPGPQYAEPAPPPPAPAPAPAPAGPVGMPEADFEDLKQAIEAESFSAQKLGVIQTVLPTAYFTIAQVGALVDLFSFSKDQVKVVELTRPKIVDLQNGFKLLSHFTFAADKDAVKKVLKR